MTFKNNYLCPVMKKATIHIEGMTCGHCANAVKSLLEEVQGVAQASVDLNGKKAEVQFDETITSVQNMVNHINSSNIYKATLS